MSPEYAQNFDYCCGFEFWAVLFPLSHAFHYTCFCQFCVSSFGSIIIDRLKIKKVFSLKCNEIEMLLLDEEIFKKVLAQIFKPVTEFVSFKSAFFSKLTQRKQHIIKRLVKTQIDEKLKKSVIDDKTNKSKDELKANLSHIFSEIDVDALWESCNTKITDIISRQDYDAALKYCCLEHAEVIVGVGKPFVTDYATLALGVMKDDESLANVIRGKYFADFDL